MGKLSDAIRRLAERGVLHLPKDFPRDGKFYPDKPPVTIAGKDAVDLGVNLSAGWRPLPEKDVYVRDGQGMESEGK